MSTPNPTPPPNILPAHALLPPSFRNTSPQPSLLAQGAEALLYRTHFLTPSRPCVLKYRPPKKWRHPTLDARLTRHRILAEARTLVKCRREGVPVPGVLALDWEGSKEEGTGEKTGGWMMVEWVEGGTVRNRLNGWIQWGKERGGKEGVEGREEELLGLMRKMGKAVARLHQVGYVHGDLTTSNLMLRVEKGGMNEGENTGEESRDERPNLDGEIMLIDFGLAVLAGADEERAVDLYVLERAFGSTHPTVEDNFQDALKAYGDSYKGAKRVLKRLEDVRMRGRKKSMIG
ncbi:MAG: serine/threonine-protein kinase bud32 [Stictis urceolatum]|nr:serine/threonine-protein kinase bud32 [Stictis urceolata]